MDGNLEGRFTGEGSTHRQHGWTLTVTHQPAEAVSATLRPVVGAYVAPGLAQVVFQVERTAASDHDGNITGYLD